MDFASGLSTIAQLAMTLTSFAGLLIAFRTRRSEWQRVELHAIRFLFKSNVGALVFALAPLPMMLDETLVQHRGSCCSRSWAAGIWRWFSAHFATAIAAISGHDMNLVIGG